MRNLFCNFVLGLTFVMSGCSTDPAPNAEDRPPGSAAVQSPDTAAPAPSATPTPAAATTVSPRPSVATTFQVPKGTEITVLLIDSISTGKNKAGDEFRASLAEPIVVNGQTVVERGARVQGRVIDSQGAGRVKGTANIRLVLTSLGGAQKPYPIVTMPLVAEAEATKGRDAGIIGGAAGVGAAIGAIAGGKSGAAKGGIIGGAAGTGTVLATRGKEVEFDSETKLKFMLEKAAELPKITS